MQLDLKIKNPGPEVTPEQVEQLCSILSGEGWMYARQIHDRYGINDRTLRAVAAASDGKIISGQKGYRLLDGSAPIEEVDHAASWLESQAREMLIRASAIRRRYHKYGRKRA